MAPQTRPPTRTGAPTAARIPMERAYPAIGPLASLYWSMRTGRWVRNTRTTMLSPSSRTRVPTGAGGPRRFQAPTTVAVSSGS